MNFSAAELIQYRVRAGEGPSSNTCPRCEPQLEQVTSVLNIFNEVSSEQSTASDDVGALNAGQPHPESNFDSELNKFSSQTTQR